MEDTELIKELVHGTTGTMMATKKGTKQVQAKQTNGPTKEVI